MQAWQHIVPTRRTWFDRIAATLGRNGQPRIELADFPTSELEAVVRVHLKDTHLAPLTRHTERYLLDNIRRHNFPDPTIKFGTVLACLPFVSGPVGRDLLRLCIAPDGAASDFRSGSHARLERDALRVGPLKLSATAICLAQQANSAVVAEVERSCANHLLQYVGNSASAHGQWIRTFLRMWVSLPMYHLLVHPKIEGLFQTACTRYVSQLEQCEVEYLYHEARCASKWLVPFLDNPGAETQIDMDELSLLTARSSIIDSRSADLFQEIHELLGDPGDDPRAAVFELPGDSHPVNDNLGRSRVRPIQNQHPPALLPGHSQPVNTARRTSPTSAISPSTPPSTSPTNSPMDSSVRIYVQILNKYMPTWRSWAMWGPDASRIERWSRLRESDRAALKELLALEARDQTPGGCKTIFDRQLAQVRGTGRPVVYGDIELSCPEDEAPDLLKRLYAALDAAQDLGDKGLDIYISLSSSESADMIPDLFEIMPRNTYGDRALEGLVNVLSEVTTVAQLEPLTALLEASQDNLEICDMLRPMLLRSIHTTFTTAQEAFTAQIHKDKVADELGKSLHQFATVLQGISWLREHFESNLQLVLQCLPSQDTLQRVFEYRSSVQHRRSYELRTDPTSGWLLTRFRGEVSQFDMPDGIMDALGFAWKRKISADCQNIALTLLRMTDVDFDIMQACLTELPNMPSWFARKWLPAFSSSAEFSFVQMAEVLALASGQFDNPSYRPWLKFWAWKFDDIIPESLTPLAARLPMPKWFNWTTNVETLLRTNALENADGLRSTANWSKELLSKYKSSLARLSQMLGDDANVGWLLVQSTNPAVQILDALEFNPGDDHWTLQSKIIITLDAGGDNAAVVAEQVQMVKNASDRLLQAAIALLAPPVSTAPVDVGSINSWDSEDAPPGYEDSDSWSEEEQALLKVVQEVVQPATDFKLPLVGTVSPGLTVL